MKEIVAILRPGRLKQTKQKLAEKGFVACTEQRVFGRGKQRGLSYTAGPQESGPENGHGISFLPKRMLTLWVNDEVWEQAVAILLETNKTGEFGDGKIFVCPAEDAVRVRTDERHHAALV